MGILFLTEGHLRNSLDITVEILYGDILVRVTLCFMDTVLIEGEEREKKSVDFQRTNRSHLMHIYICGQEPSARQQSRGLVTDAH